MINIKFIIPCFVLAIAGCSSAQKSEEDARATALIVLQEIAETKKEIHKKIDAEQNYYNYSSKNIEDISEKLDFTKNLRKLLDRAKAQGNFLRADSNAAKFDPLVANLTAGATEAVASFNRAEAERRANREQVLFAIEQLDRLSDRYSSLERLLVKLASPPSQKDHLEHMAKFIIDIGKQYQKLDKENKKAGSDPK